MTYRANVQTPHYKQLSFGQKLSDRLFGTNFKGQADAYNRVQDQLAANHNQQEYQRENIANQYEYYKKTQADNYKVQQAINENKYSWNQQGMINAGINPLAASGSLGSVAGTTTGSGVGITGSQGASTGGMSQGGLGDSTEFILDHVKDLLHEMSPSTLIKDIKDILKGGSK